MLQNKISTQRHNKIFACFCTGKVLIKIVKTAQKRVKSLKNRSFTPMISCPFSKTVQNIGKVLVKNLKN
jgi:DNA-directed RNA polymerase subunit RPC12/RpoP